MGRTRQTIRAWVLRLNPLCVRCQQQGIVRLATEVDHIIPLYRGGSESYDNRQGLCDECHKAKTIEDMGYKARPGCDVDGVPPGWK